MTATKQDGGIVIPLNTLSHIQHAHTTAAAQVGRVADALANVRIDPLAEQLGRVKAEVQRIKGEIAEVRGQLAAEMADLIGELVVFGADVAIDFVEVPANDLPFVPGESCASEGEPDEVRTEEDMREHVIRRGLASLNGVLHPEPVEEEADDKTVEPVPGPPQEPGPAPERKRKRRGR